MNTRIWATMRWCETITDPTKRRELPVSGPIGEICEDSTEATRVTDAIDTNVQNSLGIEIKSPANGDIRLRNENAYPCIPHFVNCNGKR